MEEETKTNRIWRLAEVVRKAGEGDFSFPFETSGNNDEVDALAAELRRMVEMMREHMVGRKTAEDAQRDYEEKYHRLKANIPGAVYMFAMHPDGTFSFPYVSDSSINMFDISPEDLMADASLLTRLIHPDDRQKFGTSVNRSAETHEPWREELRFIVNGEVRWYDCMSRPELQPEGDILWDGIVLEISERKRTEEALKQANLVVENSPVVLFRWRATEGWPVEMVSQNVTQFGYTPEEFLSGVIPFASIIHTEDLERVATEVRDFPAAGSDSFQQEYRILTRSGDIRWVYDRTVVERDRVGRVSHFQGIVIDITERKRAEEAQREIAERLQSIFRVAPVGIGVVRNRVMLEVNRLLCEMTGYSDKEMIGESASMLYTDQNEFERVGRDKYRQIGELGAGSVETIWRRKDGSLINVFLASTPLDESDLSKGVIFTALDISERKLFEESISTALEEKVVLLQEVHHRVKNNLQIITSLLDLQSDYIHEEGSRRFIRESQNRIRSMALVHEQLYKSGDLSFIDFASYVDELANSLFLASAVDQQKIGLLMDVRHIELDMDRAIPCGLIINELVSNAIKYAFPEGRSGRIAVTCLNAGEGVVLLEVSDNGVGLPAGLDFRRTDTMGLQIVNLLTKQLQGSIEHRADGGASFTITFPGDPPGRKTGRSAVPPLAGDFR